MKSRKLVAVSIVLFLASLFFPVFEFAVEDPVMGYDVLLWGWWGILLFNFGWFANFTWLIGLIQFIRHRYEPSLIFSLISFFLSFEGFLVSEWYFNEGSGTPVTSLGLGYYLWALALFSLAILNILKKYVRS